MKQSKNYKQYMLNLIKHLNNMKNENLNLLNNRVKTLKHFPSSIREWKDIIYLYNKNNINKIPVASIKTINLIKSYFYLYNYKLERKIRKERLLTRLRRLSSNKIYFSNGGFKHTNNKLTIILYIYNRQKYNYITKIKKQYYKTFYFFRKKINQKFNLIKSKSLNLLNKPNIKKYVIINTLNNINVNNNNMDKQINIFYLRLIKKTLMKLRLFIYYKQLIFINRSKYNYLYLTHLKKYLENIYNKNIVFNIINLRNFYLNSDILSESISLKITRNRRNILKHLNNYKNKIKIYNKNLLLYTFMKKEDKRLKRKFYNNVILKKDIINNLKYKYITGFRLEAKGRLTRRFTASRTVSKLIYKGNLMNIDSSYRGLSSIILKGNLRSNTEHTKLQSKTRIGSFGIKGWISGN